MTASQRGRILAGMKLSSVYECDAGCYPLATGRVAHVYHCPNTSGDWLLYGDVFTQVAQPSPVQQLVPAHQVRPDAFGVTVEEPFEGGAVDLTGAVSAGVVDEPAELDGKGVHQVSSPSVLVLCDTGGAHWAE